MTISNISWNDDDDDDAATVTLHSFTLMLCVHISTSSKVRKMEMKNRRENGPKEMENGKECVRTCVRVCTMMGVELEDMPRNDKAILLHTAGRYMWP